MSITPLLPAEAEEERHHPRRPSLSPRETEVVRAWLGVDSKEEACAGLHISIGTMNTHLMRVRLKYQAVGRPAPTKAALLARLVQDGLLALENL